MRPLVKERVQPPAVLWELPSGPPMRRWSSLSMAGSEVRPEGEPVKWRKKVVTSSSVAKRQPSRALCGDMARRRVSCDLLRVALRRSHSRGGVWSSSAGGLPKEGVGGGGVWGGGVGGGLGGWGWGGVGGWVWGGWGGGGGRGRGGGKGGGGAPP